MGMKLVSGAIAIWLCVERSDLVLILLYARVLCVRWIICEFSGVLFVGGVRFMSFCPSLWLCDNYLMISRFICIFMPLLCFARFLKL